jgi:hypothetical protein
MRAKRFFFLFWSGTMDAGSSIVQPEAADAPFFDKKKCEKW